MRALGASVASLLAAVALAVALLGWLDTTAPLTADEAADAAADLLQEAGVEGATVARSPSRGTYEPEGEDPIDVWKTVATVDDGRIVLWLAQQDGEPVFLDDRSPTGAMHLLTDAQFESLTEHDVVPGRGRLLRRNLLLTAGAAGIVVVAALLATAEPYPDRRRR